MNITAEKLGVYVPLLIGTAIFWAIMFKQKDGPFNIFKTIRNNTRLVSVPITVLAALIVSFPIGLLALVLPLPYPVRLSTAIILGGMVFITSTVLLFRFGFVDWLTRFISKIMACAACSPFWITLACAVSILVSDWTIVPVIIFGVTGLSYVGLALVGVNDLRDS